jgi:hypothetical protein
MLDKLESCQSVISNLSNQMRVVTRSVQPDPIGLMMLGLIQSASEILSLERY